MIVKLGKYKHSLGYSVRVYRDLRTKKFEALLVSMGYRGLWFFKDKRVWESWPCSG